MADATISLDQLNSMGAKPLAAPAATGQGAAPSGTVSLDQLQTMGARPLGTPAPTGAASGPSAPSLATLGSNLAKVPGQLSDLATHIPGAKIGQSIGVTLGALPSLATAASQGNFGTAKNILSRASQQDPSMSEVVGDTVQAAAAPASLALGAGDIVPALAGKGVLPFAARTGVNAGFGAALGGGGSAAGGGNASDIATNAGAGALAGGAASAGVEGFGALKSVINGSTDPFSSALKRVTPDYGTATPTQKAKFVDEHSLVKPRIQEGGLVSDRTLIPNDTEKAAAAEVAKIPGYKPNATNLETRALIQGEIGRQADALRVSLRSENIVVPRQEIGSIVTKATTDVPSESVLIARGDAPLANYVRAAKAAVAKSPGTLEGVLDVRQDLDAAYENARGKLAYGSDKIAPLDEIHQQARDALNEYIASHAQGTDVKAALRSQTLLYRANDVIGTKAAKEGGSTLDRVTTKVKEHPIVASGLGGAALIEGARRLMTGSF